ncbi:hypothetical protein Ahu01nite_044170 [Winogradskya humida]|uniref:Uncharacterized protein n=1 Tax=Winogradskya humida TaxID=113566 RepID=A0ABQ3ZRV2_9ACTN|nr:hypothetical protein Ahu01nite_044170 [Actinoplanes humidus]
MSIGHTAELLRTVIYLNPSIPARYQMEVTVGENQAAERLKIIMQGRSPDSATTEQPVVMPPNQALQVLTLAQRTAEEHIGIANRQADKIRTDAQATAEKIGEDAQEHSRNVRGQAEKVLADARKAAEKTTREAREKTEEARRTADKIVAEARAQARTITGDARDQAGQLKAQAQQRYDDVVGSLGTKREALQTQIESLEVFDREYRTRLASFMQTQLRALWVDEPSVGEHALVEVQSGGPLKD